MMPRTVLLVDDHDVLRGCLERVLSNAGYRVIPVATLRVGLKAFREETPDAAIVDIRLGADNGMYFPATNTRGIPIIMMTGFPDPVLEREVQELGGAYIVKPFEPSDIVSMLQALLVVRSPEPQPVRTRRWVRRAVQARTAARLGGASAALRDVSDGGVALDVDRCYDVILPAVSDLTVSGGPPIQVHLIWKRETADSRWLYGAAIEEEDRMQWERFVATVL